MERDLGEIIKTVKRVFGMDTRIKVPRLVAVPGFGLLEKPKSTPVKTSSQVITSVTPDFSSAHQWPEAKIDPNELRNRKN